MLDIVSLNFLIRSAAFDAKSPTFFRAVPIASPTGICPISFNLPNPLDNSSPTFILYLFATASFPPALVVAAALRSLPPTENNPSPTAKSAAIAEIVSRALTAPPTPSSSALASRSSCSAAPTC